MKEKWKEVEGYEGYYEVSTLGRVRSVDRRIVFKNNAGSRKYKGQILKQRISTSGYPIVNLNINKNCKTVSVHRLVATAFIEKEEGKEIVNHIDGNKRNNNVENLEWVTYSENLLHARENNLTTINVDGLLKNNIKNSKKIALIKDNKIITIKENSREMADYMIENIEVFKNTKHSTVSRAVRYKTNNGKPYKGYYIQEL